MSVAWGRLRLTILVQHAPIGISGRRGDDGFEVAMGEQLPVVSLFSGAGGLDLAVERADADTLNTADPGNGL
jgi:hypothetical protein